MTTKKPECKKFKSGRFKLQSGVANTIIIDRNDSIQTETNNSTGGVTTSHIKWVGECEYELMYLEDRGHPPEDTIHAAIKMTPLNVVIIETGKDYYIFNCTMGGANIVFTDTLWAVDWSTQPDRTHSREEVHSSNR